MAIRNALIAVDFDGTVVTHAYPEIGDDAGAVPVLKELTDNGCRLILSRCATASCSTTRSGGSASGESRSTP